MLLKRKLELTALLSRTCDTWEHLVINRRTNLLGESQTYTAKLF